MPTTPTNLLGIGGGGGVDERDTPQSAYHRVARSMPTSPTRKLLPPHNHRLLGATKSYDNK